MSNILRNAIGTNMLYNFFINWCVVQKVEATSLSGKNLTFQLWDCELKSEEQSLWCSTLVSERCRLAQNWTEDRQKCTPWTLDM